MPGIADFLRNLITGATKAAATLPAAPVSVAAPVPGAKPVVAIAPAVPTKGPARPAMQTVVLSAAAPRLSPADATAWVKAIQPALDRFEINTPVRQTAFIAQAAFESWYFTALIENLNYGAPALLNTFSYHFTPAEAAAYARQPERIANRVYANRLGNGMESTGDGWRYRGRGLFQITGKYNYEAFGQSIGMNLADVPTYLETKEGAAMGAAWFWSKRSLNVMADAGNFALITERINGGTNGLTDRIVVWERIKRVMA